MNLAKLHLHWRSYKYKGNCYKSYSLARAYREDGKNKKEIVLKLGKLTPQQVLEWKQILKSFKDTGNFFTTLEDITVTKHYDYLDVAVIRSIWESWGFDKVFNTTSNKQLEVAAIACILTINRCLEPVPKSRVSEWFQSTALAWILNIKPELINSSRIFRELAVIEQHKQAVCRHIYNILLTRHPEALNQVFYDILNYSCVNARDPGKYFIVCYEYWVLAIAYCACCLNGVRSSHIKFSA